LSIPPPYGQVNLPSAAYKAPKSVDFADSLPKTGSGNIMKRALKETYWAGHKKRVH